MPKMDLRNSAVSDTISLLTYEDLAKRLGMSRGTLANRIKSFNVAAQGLGMEQIVPHKVEPTTSVKHLYNPDRVPEIKKSLDALTTRGRGRPRKGVTPS